MGLSFRFGCLGLCISVECLFLRLGLAPQSLRLCGCVYQSLTDIKGFKNKSVENRNSLPQSRRLCGALSIIFCPTRALSKLKIYLLLFVFTSGTLA